MPASTSSKISVAGRCAGALPLGADDRDGEGDARELAARGDLGERRGRRTGVAGDQEFDRFDAERLRRVGGDELDLEAAAGHAELLHRSRHRGGEPGRAARRAAETRRASASYAARAASAARSSASRSAAASSSFSSACHCCEQRRQVGGRAAMAPRQRHPGREALLDLAQTGRIELGAIEVAGQRVRRVLQLRLRALQRFDRAGETGIELGDVLERVDGPAGERIGARVGLRDRVEREPRGVEQRLAVREAGVLGIELGPFVGAGRELRDLADLPGEPLALALEVALLLARERERLGRRAPRRPERGQRRGVDLRVRVEQGAHRGARVSPCQACWPWMSTSRSAASRSCAIVAPLPLIHARLLPCASIVGAAACGRRRRHRRRSPRRRATARARRDVELGAHLGARRAFADDAGVAAAAEGELERVDEDRLAGAGLAAQHRQARTRTRARARRR
jgi:hypothetical protein